MAVLFRDDWVCGPPIDPELGILPVDPVFGGGIIKVAALVEKLRFVGKHRESVCETSWNVDLMLIFRRQDNAGPFPECRGAATYVDGNIKNFPAHYPAQFRLGMAQLVVETTQRITPRTGMIVLNKDVANADFREFGRVIGLEKKAPMIAQRARLDDDDTREIGLNKFKHNPLTQGF